MIMNSFWIKIVCVLIIVGSLLGYNAVKDARAKDEEISRLTAELEGKDMAIAKYQSAVVQLFEEGSSSAAAAAVSEKETEPETEAETTVSNSPYADGIYEGSGTGYGGIITVKVLISGGVITDAGISSAPGEDPAYLAEANKIVSKMLEAQSADVDNIYGAPLTSIGIKEDHRNALKDA